MRTLNELYSEALAVQDACNLTGVVHSFSRAMTDLRAIAREEGWENTADINEHSVSVLWSSKIASLTGSDNPSTFAKAYAQASDRGAL
jgi:hypothetical protein